PLFGRFAPSSGHLSCTNSEVLDLVHKSCKRANLTSLVFYGKSANYLQHLMRGANELLMFGMVARTNRIGIFSLPTCTRSRPKVEMASVSASMFHRVAGDGVGVAGTSLTPEVRLWKV
ncbi:unnamed protein product, partial [Ascophyllum nodosum]